MRKRPIADSLLDTRGLQGLDFGQAHLMDADAIYAQVAPRQITLTRMTVPEEPLTAARVRHRFPCGILLVARPRNLAEARVQLDRYLSEA